ncbi:MAG: helical backbone metal receptor [Nannocystaceae bacterium]|nr:helical backbone metal receptor [Nannocystaceae bacterium]
MRKPEHRWQTTQHRAVREPASGRAAGDARTEVLRLSFDDGREHTAVLSLARQQLDRAALRDPALPQAVMAWLAARGQRSIALHDEHGAAVLVRDFTLDELGADVHDARRVITLAPSNAELVDALGAFDRVIACEDSSDHPPQVARCERLGPDLGPDLDRIAALRPDLVVSSLTVPGMERIVTGLHARGVPQLVCAPRSLAEVLADLQRLGRALSLPEAAGAAAASLRQQQQALLAERPAVPKRVYLEWWPRPMYTPGRACFSNELIALAGGVNVFGDREGQSLEIDAAELCAADPDACFVSWCGVAEAKLDPAGLGARAGLQQLRAAVQGQVFALDERFSGRPGPHMLEAARRMRAALWPG